jgi:site-specific DNA-adenine methylase
MNYGVPYKGSKNKLAERIMRFLPKRDNLIDLFCGGCAVSHAALLMGKYKHIHINDVNWMCPTLFIDALNGKYNDETRWISREDFSRLKNADPYVAIVWSFGNNMRDYLYSKEIEPLKRAVHYAIFFNNYEPGRALGHDLSFVDGIIGVHRRYVAVSRYFRKFRTFRLQSLESAVRVWKLSTLLGQCGSTQNFGLPPRGQAKKISKSILDYAEVEIPKNSVIYCDIPYINTNVYDTENTFDYERFYQWAESHTEPVFISSYDTPANRFDCVMEWDHRSTLCTTANIRVKERLFIPKHQTERGNRPPRTPSLFDDLE